MFVTLCFFFRWNIIFFMGRGSSGYLTIDPQCKYAHFLHTLLGCLCKNDINMCVCERERERYSCSIYPVTRMHFALLLFFYVKCLFFSFFSVFQHMRPLLIIVIYYRIKTLIDFWCRRRLNIKSLFLQKV